MMEDQRTAAGQVKAFTYAVLAPMVVSLLFGIAILAVGYGVLLPTNFVLVDMRRTIVRAHDLMLDAETGTRGYLATNDSSFLEPVHPAVRDLPAANQHVLDLLSKSRATGRLVSANAARMDASREWQTEWLSPALDGTMSPQQDLIAVFSSGKQLMDKYRAADQSFAALVDEWQARILATYWILLLTSHCVLLFGIMVSGLAYLHAQRRLMARIATSVRLIRDRMVDVGCGNLASEAVNLPSGCPADLLSINSSLNGMTINLRRQREAERQIQQLHLDRMAAEQLAASRSAFLSTMSHEIRTPLNGVIGPSQVLLTTTLTADQHNLVELIVTNGEALMSIVNDILDFSKIEAGKLQLENRVFSLRRCLEQALDTVALAAEKKQLVLCLDMDASCPEFVYGDSTRLRQTLLNLLSNAVKFTRRGQVLLTVEVAQPAAAEPAAALPEPIHPSAAPLPSAAAPLVCAAASATICLNFSVADTGIGMSDSDMSRLFIPFAQAEASTTRRFGGTGLGLSISQRLVKAMGGSGIAVASEAGVGSKFSFQLHTKVPESADRPTATPLPASWRGKQALVLADNAAVQSSLTKQLSSWGLVCTPSVEDVKSCDVCIVDANLSEVLHDTGAVRTSGRPLILLTPLSFSQTTDSHVRKPVHSAELFAAVSAALSPGAASAPEVQVRSSALAPLPPLSLLLAEDNVVNQRVARRMLATLGYQVDVVNNGREALDAVKQKTYDCILMDLHMPEMDGFQATRLIHESVSAERLPCIVPMTAAVNEAERDLCAASGMRYFISKPLFLEELRGVLNKVAEDKFRLGVKLSMMSG